MEQQDRLDALVRAVTTRPGFTAMMGTEVLEVAPGAVGLAIPRRPDLLQFGGHFHGGVIAGLADHAAGGAVTTALPEGRIAVTIDLHINYLAPAAGERLIAHARAVQVGGTIATAQVDICARQEGAETRCAIATVTLRAVDFPAAGRASP